MVNILVAYPYMSAEVISFLKERGNGVRFLLDSGAFTAWKAGRTINLDEYCKFIESLPITPWRYFTLDVVGNPHETKKNYETMLARGFKPVPIFTRGEDLSILEEYYQTSDVVGIGGLVGTRGNRGFVKGIMERVASRRVHWLGFTSLPFLKYFKPYMADSSSWEMGARFASCPVYLGNGLPLVSLRKATVEQQLQNELIVAAINREGLNPEDFKIARNWNGGYSLSRRLGARSMRRFSQDVEKNLGTHLFLAAATSYAAGLLLEGI